MGRTEDQMVEEMREAREELGQALDDIEAYGERFGCPSECCDTKECTKSCFAKSCFDWCLTHSQPSSEERHGLASVKVKRRSKDSEGNLISETSVEKRRVCGHERAKEFPGDCHIITCPFVAEDQLWEFEDEQRMGEIMARDSPYDSGGEAMPEDGV